MMKDSEPSFTSRPCLNCSTPLSAGAQYCHHCGQSIKESRLSVLDVVTETITNIFNFDGRVWRTVRHLYSPSMLTAAYVAGQRKRFMNPARMFLFSLIILVSLLLSSMSSGGLADLTGSSYREVHLAEQKVVWDSLMTEIQTPANEQLLQQVQDSIYGDINIDSLLLDTDVSILNMDLDQYNIRQKDMLELSSDDLLEKYEVTGLANSMFLKQYQKVMNNPEGGLSYLIKNLPWVILVLIFLMAAFMKLLYIRGDYYYVEHLVLMLYSHSLLWLAMILLSIAGLITAGGSLFVVGGRALGISLIVVQYVSLKRYYNQGWFKTLIKQITINSAYFILFILVASVGLLLSFFLF